MNTIIRWQEIVASSIDGLPVTLAEVLESPLFGGSDFAQVVEGTFTPAQIRLYVGSWLVNGKQFPTPIYADYETRLQTVL